MVCIFIFHGMTVKTENTRPSVPSFCELVHNIAGAIHSTKLSGNFGPKLNGSVRSNRKSFEKTGPPFEVVLFSRSDRSDRKMTVPFDHSDSFLFPVAASVYRWSFCDVAVPSLENLLSHDCQATTGKCLVYLFVAFAEKKKIIQVKSQSVFASRMQPFPPKPIMAANTAASMCTKHNKRLKLAAEHRK